MLSIIRSGETLGLEITYRPQWKEKWITAYTLGACRYHNSESRFLVIALLKTFAQKIKGDYFEREKEAEARMARR